MIQHERAVKFDFHASPALFMLRKKGKMTVTGEAYAKEYAERCVIYS